MTAVRNAQFVLHQHVMFGRETLGDIVELLFFVQIDKDLTSDRLKQAGTVDLARLEDHITVGEDGRRPPLLDVFDDLQRAGKEAVNKWIVEQEAGNGEDARIARILAAIALQRAKIIRVSQLGSQLLEEAPEVPRTLGADLAIKVLLRSEMTRSLSSNVLSTSNRNAVSDGEVLMVSYSLKSLLVGWLLNVPAELELHRGQQPVGKLGPLQSLR